MNSIWLYDIADVFAIDKRGRMRYFIFSTRADAWDFYTKRKAGNRNLNPPMYREWSLSIFDRSWIVDHRNTRAATY